MKLKRFAPLCIMLAILTLGGVFAAWNFAGSNAGTGISGELQFGMENVQYSTSRGTYSVTTNGQKIFTVDQTKIDTATPANNDYTAKLVVNPTATITIRFTPNLGASDEVVTNGLLSEFFFTFKQGSVQTPYRMDADGNHVENGVEGTDYQAIILDGVKVKIRPMDETPGTDELKWMTAADGNGFTVTLGATEIAKHVKLNDVGFVLDTIEEYYAFGSCLDSYTCAVVVQDPTANDSAT